MKPEDHTPSQLQAAGELGKFKAWADKEFDKSRDMESKSIDEFEKTLWLANAGAATVTIGYLTASTTSTIYQFIGSLLFVIAIIFLLAMKLVSEVNSSRDRSRRQASLDSIFTEDLPIANLEKVRDHWFTKLKRFYQILKFGSAVLFIVGCLVTMVGVIPKLETHNKSIQPTASSSAGLRR